MTVTSPFVLTLALDPNSFAICDRLRRQHFPPARNYLSAHLTLFHALPAVEEPLIRRTLESVCSTLGPIPLSFLGLRFLGRGVAIEVSSSELIALRRRLAREWDALQLGAQDKQGFRPHITIQNKVEAGEARRLYDQMRGEWRGWSGEGTGLLLWRYLGGPWELIADLAFAGER